MLELLSNLMGCPLLFEDRGRSALDIPGSIAAPFSTALRAWQSRPTRVVLHAREGGGSCDEHSVTETLPLDRLDTSAVDVSR